MKTPETLLLPLRVEPEQNSHGACLVLLNCDGMTVATSPESASYQAPGQEQDEAELGFVAMAANYHRRMRETLQRALDTIQDASYGADPLEMAATIRKLFAELDALDVPVPSGANVACNDCDWTGRESQLGKQLAEIPDLCARIAPGETVPAGECPICGALASLTKVRRKK